MYFSQTESSKWSLESLFNHLGQPRTPTAATSLRPKSCGPSRAGRPLLALQSVCAVAALTSTVSSTPTTGALQGDKVRRRDEEEKEKEGDQANKQKGGTPAEQSAATKGAQAKRQKGGTPAEQSAATKLGRVGKKGKRVVPPQSRAPQRLGAGTAATGCRS